MSRIKLKISYDGTDFCGWQKQTKLEHPSSIQSELEQALQNILNAEIKTVGSGRTDAGVHAYAQYVHFDTEADLGRYDLVRALNTQLPSTISVLEAWEAPKDFHALHSAEEKSYIFYIHNDPVRSALRSRFSVWEPRPLDVEWLNECSKFLVKKQDFKSFQNRGVDLKTTIREVTVAHWFKKDDLLCFEVAGTGFLKQMVRNIVGTQIGLFKHGEKPEQIQVIIEAMDRSKALETAPPEGLHLQWVKYPQSLDIECRKL